MKLFKEFAPNSKNKKGEYRPKRAGSFIESDLYLDTVLRMRDPGFGSIYSFSEEHAREQESMGHSKGLGRFPVYSDTLWMDFDDGAKSMVEAEALCRTRGWAYQLWLSGGKGYHLGIPCEPMYGHSVPYSQLQFARTLGVPIDETLYQHGRMFANPGRIHPKTGNRKKLVRSVDGKKIHIPIVEKPLKEFKVLGGLDDEFVKLNVAFMQCQFSLESEPPGGSRHTTLWSIALNFQEAGIARDTAIDILLAVNQSWSNPKTDEEVERAVDQAYE